MERDTRDTEKEGERGKGANKARTHFGIAKERKGEERRGEEFCREREEERQKSLDRSVYCFAFFLGSVWRT